MPLAAVGIIPGAKFEIKRTKLEPGDILIGYTDGVTEALSPQQKFFSSKKLCSLLESPAASAEELIKTIKSDLFAHIDNEPQFDDITMIAIHRKPTR